MNLLKRTAAFVVVALVLGTGGCSKSSSDAAITDRVKSAIYSQPGLKRTKVNVSTNEKVVHLSGSVTSRDERAMLIAVARKVDGVKAVKTDLVVTPQQSAAVKPQQKAAVKPKAKPKVEARPKRELRAQNRVTTRPGEFEGTGR